MMQPGTLHTMHHVAGVYIKNVSQSENPMVSIQYMLDYNMEPTGENVEQTKDLLETHHLLFPVLRILTFHGSEAPSFRKRKRETRTYDIEWPYKMNIK